MTLTRLDPDALKKLEEHLLKPYRAIGLVPFVSIDGAGRLLRLVPERGGTPIGSEFVAVESLPVLDIATAGIPIDNAQSILRGEAYAFLSDKKFTITPNFDVMAAMATMPMLKQYAELCAMSVSMRLRMGTESGRAADPEQEFRRKMAEIRPLSFTITAEGDEVPGLDLSRPVAGFPTVIASFVLPKGPSGHSRVVPAFAAALEFYRNLSEHRKLKSDREKYLEAESGKWWFRLFNKKAQFAERLERSAAALERSRAEAEGAIAEL